MESTNRRWQNHLRAKGLYAFFLDRLRSHAMSSAWQYSKGPFTFPISDRETEDELSRAFFELSEDFPTELFVELTARCNLRCAMCARGVMTRPTGDMSMELFTRIVDEIAERQPHCYVHWYGIGDPLMDPGLFDKLAFARERGLANTVLFTNGQLLLENEAYARLAESGVSILGVDIDGLTQEVYGKVRRGGDVEVCKQGIARLASHIRDNGLRTRLELAYHIYGGVNDHEVGAFIEWCARHGYEYKLVTMHDWAGMRRDVPKSAMTDLTDPHFNSRVNPCPNLWRGMLVGWDGTVGACFMDADMRDRLGNAGTESLERIWQEAHRNKRKEHVAGAFRGACEHCTCSTEESMPRFGSALYPDVLRS